MHLLITRPEPSLWSKRLYRPIPKKEQKTSGRLLRTSKRWWQDKWCQWRTLSRLNTFSWASNKLTAVLFRLLDRDYWRPLSINLWRKYETGTSRQVLMTFPRIQMNLRLYSGCQLFLWKWHMNPRAAIGVRCQLTITMSWVLGWARQRFQDNIHRPIAWHCSWLSFRPVKISGPGILEPISRLNQPKNQTDTTSHAGSNG